ncbi:MAG: HAD family hydrolase [Cylindrospermopsis raciborskii KL1]|jgi:phosphoglycolate phosphatase|uniref:HAD family hydrolase n=1 Tax=Cylindrospermopsis raciborskii TaxID=77022 RepID=UPI001A34ABD8|nr:HAD family hydrolase [Cylindrospermopsis raciborskii]MBG0744562.1 HAD family hydrolase [Cylindrospermopsis raciborskii KL1]
MVTIKCGNVVFSDIQAVLFDKNGTLEDSEDFLRSLGQKTVRLIDAQIPGIGEPLSMALGISGDVLDLTGLMAVASRKETEIAAAAYIAETGRGWFDCLKIARQALEEAHEYIGKNPCPLYPGVLDLLELLSSRGIKLGILSAATTKGVEQFVTCYGLRDYLELEMGVDEGLGKPDPRLFLLACQNLGVQPQNALMVGDSIGDMQMARDAKAGGCIGIAWNNNLAQVRGADVVIHQLTDIQVLTD